MTKHTHDRDATVGRLLAGAMARGSAEPTGACLDADTLAAWADGGLDAGEVAAAEAHAADCARCQAMLAAMARTLPAPTSAASPWRKTALRWLVPLAAAAAAVVVWMVVPMRDDSVNVRQVSQIAESSPPPAAGPAASPEVVPVPSPTEKQVTADPRREMASSAADSGEADKKIAAPPDAGAVQDSARGNTEIPLQPAAQPAAGAISAAPVPAAAATRAFALATPETVVVSSNPGSRWKLLPGGAVQRSADGGSTWQTESTGVSETLSAGSSPSPSVCWLVGPGGIVLLSTDGRTWKRVPFPEAVALVAVRATDDQSAVVTTADGREMVTDNGGRTWARAPGR